MAGITSTKKIKGQPHLLAYITPNEVEKLKALGGQETMTPEGIPAYPPGMGDPNYEGKTSSSKTNNPPSSKGRDLDYQMSGGKTGSTFETYRGDKNVGVDNYLKQKFSSTKQKKEAKKASKS
jgi:hypothetical protein